MTLPDFDLGRALAIAGVTVVVVLAAALGVGIALLFRRGSRSSLSTGTDQLEQRANILLVRLDDAIAADEDELDFAIAQFGEARAREFAGAVASARAQVAEAFRLKQQLDDAFPDSERQRREWNNRIVALCETAEESLARQRDAFSRLRSIEASAPSTVDSLRVRLDALDARLEQGRAQVGELTERYAPAAVQAAVASLAAATHAAAEAREATDDAAADLKESGVNSVAESLAKAQAAGYRASQELDTVEQAANRLAEASDALAALLEDTRTDLAEARTRRDGAIEPDSAATIADAITLVDAALTGALSPAGRSDPVASIDEVREAVSALDAAMAGERNARQRLEHARTALVGTLVSAKSQIEAARSVARGAGADARTRLAEAERQLMLAEAESDPVEALDAARRAVTHARDADALARYRG